MTELEKNNDVDLADIFKVIWLGKWKVIGITVIAFLIVLVYSSNLPKVFKTEVTIHQSSRSVFTKYFLLNEVLTDHFNLYAGKNKVMIDHNYIPVTPSNIFNLIRNEFNDKEEIAYIIEKLSKESDNFKNLSKKDIYNLSDSFVFFPAVNYNDNFSKLSFNWRDVEEGKLIIDSVFLVVLNNVKETLINHINDLAETIDYRNENKLKALNIKIKLNKKQNKENDKKKLKFLYKHLKIAKELNIKDFFNGNLDEFTSETIYENEDKAYNIPYFAFGYKAIQSEISSILKRTNNKEAYFNNSEYRILLRKITDIKGDMTAQTLKDTIDILERDDLTKWISYNLSNTSPKLTHNITLYSMVGIILGLIFGVTFVLISQHFKKNHN